MNHPRGDGRSARTRAGEPGDPGQRIARGSGEDSWPEGKTEAARFSRALRNSVMNKVAFVSTLERNSKRI